jgi:hypothetical protein
VPCRCGPWHSQGAPSLPGVRLRYPRVHPVELQALGARLCHPRVHLGGDSRPHKAQGAPRGCELSPACTLCDYSSTFSLWLPVLIVVKSPPRHPRYPPYHPGRGLVHTNHTRCAESRNGCIQRISGPPCDPEIWHVALAAVPAANLGPGTRPEPAPTTHVGVRTEFDRRLARRQPTGGAAATMHVRGGGGGGGGARGAGKGGGGGAAWRTRANPHPCASRLSRKPLSGSCKSRRKESSSLFKILASLFTSLGHSQATWSFLSMKWPSQ